MSGELLDQSRPEARIPAAQRLDRNVNRVTLSHEAVVLQHKCQNARPDSNGSVPEPRDLFIRPAQRR